MNAKIFPWDVNRVNCEFLREKKCSREWLVGHDVTMKCPCTQTVMKGILLFHQESNHSV